MVLKIKKIIVILITVLSVHNITAIDVLPQNAPNKEYTVQLELWIKWVKDYINANKPVGAAKFLPYARDELRRVRMHLSLNEIQLFEKEMNALEQIIGFQKQYQIKKYGKLLEVN